jgi:tryptophan-rich sensory protein
MFSRPRPGLWRLGSYALLFVGFAALINAWIFMGDGQSWAQSLVNPSWSPPGVAIGIIWTLLFGTLAIAAFWVDVSDDVAHRIAARMGLFLWWISCMSWPLLYFQVKIVQNGFYATIQAIIVGLVVLPIVFRASPRAGLVLIPLQVWLIFALFLSWQTWQLNAVPLATG